MARPLEGALSDRIRAAREDEMAAGPLDAVRGRLIEGARGDQVDSGGPGA